MRRKRNCVREFAEKHSIYNAHHFAKESGLPIATVYQLWEGHSSLSQETIAAIMAAFEGATVDELIYLEKKQGEVKQ